MTIFLLSLLLAMRAGAQSDNPYVVTVMGNVVDSQLNGIENCKIVVKGLDQEITSQTDSLGLFAIQLDLDRDFYDYGFAIERYF